MFDIGFWELVLISVVALIVLGPERLPHAIRTVLRTVNHLKRVTNHVKDELSHELKIQELHENLRKAERRGMQNLSPEPEDSVKQIKADAEEVQQSDAQTSYSDPASSANSSTDTKQ